MDWTELCLAVPTADADRAADIAHMVVPYGLYIEDYSDLLADGRQLIDEELLARDRTTALVHVYLPPEQPSGEAVAFLCEHYTAAGIPHTVTTRGVREEDWAHNWKQFFKPLPIGDKLLICPTWEPVPPDNTRAVLAIDPGMAFGTGGHDTTRLVLEVLEKKSKPDIRFLDVGCGSGILSIAALLLGAACAVGVDIDTLAVKTAVENGAINGFHPPVYTILQGDLVEKVQGKYDIIAANIVADAIIALTPAALPFLAEGGVYITSGIIDTREREVTDALQKNGLVIRERYERAGWLCLVAARN